jgi:hypothetical protein
MQKFQEFYTNFVEEGRESLADIFEGFDTLEKSILGVDSTADLTFNNGSKITIYSKDRSKYKEDLRAALKSLESKKGIKGFEEISTSSSSVDAFRFYMGDTKRRLTILFKENGPKIDPTYTASITEIIPCLLFTLDKSKGDVPTHEDLSKTLMTFLETNLKTNKKLDFSGLKCFGSEDISKAEKVIGDMLVHLEENKSVVKTKFGNGVAIYRTIRGPEFGDYDNVIWGYRAKPKGVNPNHKGDIFLARPGGKKFLGVSLKAGGENTAEPQLNSYVNKVFKIALDETTKVSEHPTKADEEKDQNKEADGNSDYESAFDEYTRKVFEVSVKKLLKDDPKYPNITFDDVRKKGYMTHKPEYAKLVADFEKTNKADYEKLYNAGLEVARNEVIKMFNGLSPDEFRNWIGVHVIGETEETHLIVVKAIKDTAHIVKTNATLENAADVATKVTANVGSGVQNFVINIIGKDGPLESMNMSIRTNKSGAAHKLNQIYNLAIKYNGLIKK